jgi:hypothetical protein
MPTSIHSTEASTDNLIAFPPRGVFREPDLFGGKHLHCRPDYQATACALPFLRRGFFHHRQFGEFIYAQMTVERGGPPTTAITVRQSGRGDF